VLIFFGRYAVYKQILRAHYVYNWLNFIIGSVGVLFDAELKTFTAINELS